MPEATTHDRFVLRVGRALLTVGIAITALGLVLGFAFLMSDHDGWAKRFLFTVPIGFLLLFTGLVTLVLNESRSDER